MFYGFSVLLSKVDFYPFFMFILFAIANFMCGSGAVECGPDWLWS